MTQSNNRKPSSLQASIWTVKLFVGAVAAAGVASYALAGPEYYPMAAVAALTAIVIMTTADHVGRGWSSVLLVPLLVICGGFQAMNLEHSYQFYFEAPAKAAYEKKLEPLQAEADRTAGRLKTAEASLDAFQPEKVDCSPCRNTRREAAERDAQRRAPLALAVETAKAEKKAAAEALDTAQKGYRPFADPSVILVIGGLLDIAALAAIAYMAGAGRRAVAEWEARLAAEAKAEAKRDERRQQRAREFRAKQREASRKAKEKAAKAAAKAKPPQGFKPFLIAANDK